STFTVNRLGDSGTGSGTSGDLRYCINQANGNNQSNTIVFDSTVFATHQKIMLSGSQLELSDIGGTQTITGPAAGVTVDGGQESRILWVHEKVTASLVGLTISGGQNHFNEGSGGVENQGTLTMTGCTVSKNLALLANGGGLENWGTLKMIDCTISGNSALGGG